ncbi:MAG: transporter ATP-binding protein, partial [Conexibacter sp.]|nr:transporter ATP-binding protein [Conexibacter sp.]
ERNAPGPAGRAAPANAIVIEGATKRYGPTLALDAVSMVVPAGEARALVGRNGAGKSTLVSLLTGVERADGGRVAIDGDVACVYQRSRLVPAMTAAENVLLTQYPRRAGGMVDWPTLRAIAGERLAAWGLGAEADTPVERLDPVAQKVVEICRALAQEPSVLLLDEPTAGLDKRDAERLFAVVEALKREHVTLVYVSHHLDEVYRLCDSATVLRDGRHVVTAPLTELPLRGLVAAMVGEDAESGVAAHAGAGADPRPSTRRVRGGATTPGAGVLLDAQGLHVGSRVHGVDLAVAAGECVGLAGIDGSGKAEVGAVLGGLLAPTAGTVLLAGQAMALGDVRAALRAGVGYVPEDRHARGMVPLLSVAENATMTSARGLVRRGILRDGDRVDAYERLAEEWEIIASSPQQPIGELSGGNQQKCVMARALATDPRVLILQNPTAGVDVAAKASIMTSLEERLERGSGVLVVSEDPDDFALCARILVIVKGRITARLDSNWTEGDLVSAMQGAEQ